jgi:catalase (peroxidase I)
MLFQTLLGGSNGATMRFSPECDDPENAGLAHARTFLEAVKELHPGVSFSDLWILAAYVAIEHSGGPKIEFQGGRVDGTEAQAVKPGRLPAAEKGCEDGVDEEGRANGWEKLCDHIRNDIFYRMGINDREIVALLCGGHVYGRCHTESSGYAGAWVENMTLFSNEYAADMIEDKWIAVTHDSKMPDGGEVPGNV